MLIQTLVDLTYRLSFVTVAMRVKAELTASEYGLVGF